MTPHAQRIGLAGPAAELRIALIVGLLVLAAHILIVTPLRLVAAAPPYQNFIGLGVTTVLQLVIMLVLAGLMGPGRLSRLSGFLLMQLPLMLGAAALELVDTVQFYERFNLPYHILTWTSFLGHALRLYTVFLVWSALVCVMVALVELERQGRRLAEAQALARTAELAALRYQIQPHFLFNTFSTLHALVDEGRREPALKMLERLATVFRSVLSKADHDFSSLRAEIDFLQDYLAIEQFRFGEKLTTEFDIEPEAARCEIPRLLLQPLVENAIKHGRPRDGSPLALTISAGRQGGQLLMRVRDNGPGPGADPVSGVGLRNVTDRLVRYYGEDAALELGDAEPCGTVVIVTLPARRKESG